MKPVALPLDLQQALDWTMALQDTWNKGDKKKVLDFFSPKCQWLNTNQWLKGTEQISHFLDEVCFRRLHHSLHLSLWCFSQQRMAIEVVSEWQCRDNGLWHRGLSLAQVQLDAAGLISALTVVATKQQIATHDRQLSQTR